MSLTKADLSKKLSEKIGLSNREAKDFIETFFGEISNILASGKCVKLFGFGNFMLRDKNARPGRNPRTGEAMTIAPRRVVVFRPGQKLKNKAASHHERSEQQSVPTDT